PDEAWPAARACRQTEESAWKKSPRMVARRPVRVEGIRQRPNQKRSPARRPGMDASRGTSPPVSGPPDATVATDRCTAPRRLPVDLDWRPVEGSHARWGFDLSATATQTPGRGFSGANPRLRNSEFRIWD